MAFNYTVNQKTALVAQMARQHKIKRRTESWEWAETWKHCLTAHGTEYVQREMKEMKPLFDLRSVAAGSLGTTWREMTSESGRSSSSTNTAVCY